MQEVIERLQDHDKRFDDIDKRLDEHDKRFDNVDKRFDQIDGQIDFIIKKVLEHDDKFERIEEKMATKDDINKITNTLDKLVKLVETKVQETILITHGLRNLEDKVEEHDRDIRKMKPALGLS